MAKVKLTLEVEPELRRRIKISAASKDESLREWVHRAILRELEEERLGEADELDGGEELIMPPAGAKPVGRRVGAPRVRGGTVSDAVIEDRRAGW